MALSAMLVASSAASSDTSPLSADIMLTASPLSILDSGKSASAPDIIDDAADDIIDGAPTDADIVVPGRLIELLITGSVMLSLQP
jgi:hypothetical protein